MRDSPISILHLVNPHPITWSVLSQTIAKELSLPIVSYMEWLSRLEEGVSESQSRNNVNGDTASLGNRHALNHSDNPALALIEYFRAAAAGGSNKEAFGLPRLDMQQAVKVSPSLRNAKRLTVEDALSWLPWWKEEGHVLDEGTHMKPAN